MDFNCSVPFFPNTVDDTHCWQASLKMVLKYFQKDKEYSWEELDKITSKKKDLWTWPTAGMLWLAKDGFDIKIIEAFNYQRLSEEGKDYIYSEFGEEVGKAQEEHAEIAQGVDLAKQLISKSLWTNEIPELKDIRDLLKKGYLIICNVNTAKINKEDGYVGHFVVLKGFDDNNLIFHDPGLPPHEEKIINNELFEASWAFPNVKAKNIKAIRLK